MEKGLTKTSRADVLIVLRDSPLRFDERIPLFIPSGIGVSVDAFPYTLEEAERALREGWGVVEIALNEGIPLFGDGEELRGIECDCDQS
ncbi:MAG: hypothetical protein ACUVXI_12490 [bacterium]